MEDEKPNIANAGKNRLALPWIGAAVVAALTFVVGYVGPQKVVEKAIELPKDVAAKVETIVKPVLEQQQTEQPVVKPLEPKVATTTPEQDVVTDLPQQPSSEMKIESPPASATVAVARPEVKPSFDTVRVEPDGSAVIAGRAEPGADVVMMLNDTEVGKTKANQIGEFVIIPDKALPEGTGSISLLAKKDGKQIASQEQVAVIVKPKAQEEALVAVVKPDAPTKLIPSTKPSQKPSDAVKLDTIDYDADGNIIFSGRASAGASIRIYADNVLVGEAKAGSDGKWLFDQSPRIAAGNHTLRVDETDTKGQVTSRVELPFLREDKNRVAEIQQSGEVGTAFSEKAAGMGGQDRIIIQPGNSLWKVSRVIYGKGMRYTVIFDANRDQIKNPNKIYPGQIFTAPKL